jgi:ATP-dependent DNA ligase
MVRLYNADDRTERVAAIAAAAAEGSNAESFTLDGEAVVPDSLSRYRRVVPS